MGSTKADLIVSFHSMSCQAARVHLRRTRQNPLQRRVSVAIQSAQKGPMFQKKEDGGYSRAYLIPCARTLQTYGCLAALQSIYKGCWHHNRSPSGS
eukprot:2009327-Amphidinium_carterae.1